MRDSGKKPESSSLVPTSYQLIPLLKILENGSKCILICDGVGVGKTISAAYVLIYCTAKTNRPSLVVTPPILVDKWILELRNKFNVKSIPIRTREDLHTAVFETQEWATVDNLLTYVMADSLLTQKVTFDFFNLSAVVFDEIHNLRNWETLSHRSAIEIAGKGEYRIGLSATPINNRLEDLSSEFHVLLPSIDWNAIDSVVKDLWGLDRNSLSIPFITRYTKERLGIHFAKREVRDFAISYPPKYYDFVSGRIDGMKPSTSFFDKVTYYRMAASSPEAIFKALGNRFNHVEDQKIATLNEITKNKKGHILLFCEFENTAKYISREIADWETFLMTGETPLFERQSIIDAFRNSENAILIMTPVGSEGLDLQFSDTIINYDLHWNPMKIEQRIGRIDRIGQKKEKISILNLIVNGSIDQLVLSVLRRKLKLIDESVFVVGDVLEPKKEAPVLFDREVIEAELNEGDKLISIIDWNKKIPELDYYVLQCVNQEYCIPEKTLKAGKNGLRAKHFLYKDENAGRWMKQIHDSSEKIVELLAYYS